MLIGILGPLTIDGDGGPVALGGSKRRLLLTLLAISHPRPVSVARITDVLWGEDAPPSAAANRPVLRVPTAPAPRFTDVRHHAGGICARRL